MNAIPPHIRFREARERIALSPDEVAIQFGVSDSCIWDIEMCAGDLEACYSPREIQRLCGILGIRPINLFVDNISESAVSAEQLVQLIHQECRLREISLEKFEDAVGWKLSQCIEPPDFLLEDMSIDGLQWLCREIRIDWYRVLLGL